MRDLLRNFPAHLCSLIPLHVTFLLRAKYKVLYTYLIDLMLLKKILLTCYEKLPNCWKGICLKDSKCLCNDLKFSLGMIRIGYMNKRKFKYQDVEDFSSLEDTIY